MASAPPSPVANTSGLLQPGTAQKHGPQTATEHFQGITAPGQGLREEQLREQTEVLPRSRNHGRGEHAVADGAGQAKGRCGWGKVRLYNEMYKKHTHLTTSGALDPYLIKNLYTRGTFKIKYRKMLTLGKYSCKGNYRSTPYVPKVSLTHFGFGLRAITIPRTPKKPRNRIPTMS